MGGKKYCNPCACVLQTMPRIIAGYSIWIVSCFVCMYVCVCFLLLPFCIDGYPSESDVSFITLNHSIRINIDCLCGWLFAKKTFRVKSAHACIFRFSVVTSIEISSPISSCLFLVIALHSSLAVYISSSEHSSIFMQRYRCDRVVKWYATRGN